MTPEGPGNCAGARGTGSLYEPARRQARTAAALGHDPATAAPPGGALPGLLSRNSRRATAHFKLPPDQVIEIGTQVDL